MATVKEEFLQDLVERYEADPGMLIPMMQDLQAEHGYLPPEELRRLAARVGVPLTRVYGVAMFYSTFRLSPRGQHDVTLCMGTVCYLKGAPKIAAAICEEYGIQPGGTTPDRLFTLQAVNCVGACALAPVMIVDGAYHDGVTAESALAILRALAAGPAEPPAAPAAPAVAAPEAVAPGTAAPEAAAAAAPAPAAAAPPAEKKEGRKAAPRGARKPAGQTAGKNPARKASKKPAKKPSKKPKKRSTP